MVPTATGQAGSPGPLLLTGAGRSRRSPAVSPGRLSQGTFEV